MLKELAKGRASIRKLSWACFRTPVVTHFCFFVLENLSKFKNNHIFHVGWMPQVWHLADGSFITVQIYLSCSMYTTLIQWLCLDFPKISAICLDLLLWFILLTMPIWMWCCESQPGGVPGALKLLSLNKEMEPLLSEAALFSACSPRRRKHCILVGVFQKKVLVRSPDPLYLQGYEQVVYSGATLGLGESHQ